MKSEFDKWFVAQFGPRPCPYGTVENDKRQRWMDCAQEVEKMKSEIEAIDRWDNSERAALYAWNARGRS